MKKIYLLFILFSICKAAFSQVTLSDSSYCTKYVLYPAVVGMTPTDIGLYSDDSYSGVLNFGPGFTFNYYGTPNTQFIVGENGMITFDLALAGGYDPWPISAALLGNSSAYNSICGPWCDIYGAVSTPPQPIYYSLEGTAPNRSVAITWCGVDMFSCTTQWITTQIIMYETSNIIEVHIGHKDICAGWNGGYAICGVENAGGTAATVAPGRDYPSVWSVLTTPYEAWRFTPTGAGTSYTVASIPYAPIPYSTATVYWYDSTTGAYLGMGDSLTVMPTVTTTYKAGVLGCNDTIWGYITVGPVGTAGTGATIHSVTPTNPTVCGKCDGTLTLIGGIMPGRPDTVHYTYNGVPQPPVYTSAGPDSTITITGLCAGTYTDIYILNGISCYNVVGPFTLVNPPIGASFALVEHLGCTGDTVFLTNNSAPAPSGTGIVNYWNFGDGSPIDSVDVNPTYIFGAPGTYTISLVYSTYYSCYDTVTQSISFLHSLVTNFVTTPDTVCLGSPITFTNLTTGNAGPTYSWSFGDGGASVVTSPVYTYLAGGLYNVTLLATDTLGCSESVTQQVDIISIAIKAPTNSFILCNPQDSTTLSVIPTTTGGFAGINYSWAPTAGLGNPLGSITQFYDTSAPNLWNYTITGSITLPSGAVCSAQDTIRVNSYNLIASYFPTFDTVCLGTPSIFNNMTEYYTLPNYAWTFEDGTNSTVISPIHTFNVGGIYPVKLTAVDINNCVSDTIENIYVVSIKTRTYTHDTSVCLTEPMPFTATVQVLPPAFYPLTSYIWNDIIPGGNYLTNPNDSNTMFFGPSAVPYQFYHYQFDAYYTINSNLLPCDAHDTEDIYVYPPDTLRNVTQNTTVEYGGSVQLNADSAYYFWWTPNDGTLNNPDINNPVATPKDSITVYTVYGRTRFGCLDSAKVTLTVIPDQPPFIPTAFTPNGDGLNDFFIVKNINYTKLVQMNIFNRWGNLLYTTIDATKGWDGTWKGVPQDMGTYFYEVILANPDGVTKSYKGDFTLIR